MSVFTFAISCLTTYNLPWFIDHPGSYAILFFTALDFTSTTSHIHNLVAFSLLTARRPSAVFHMLMSWTGLAPHLGVHVSVQHPQSDTLQAPHTQHVQNQSLCFLLYASVFLVFFVSRNALPSHIRISGLNVGFGTDRQIESWVCFFLPSLPLIINLSHSLFSHLKMQMITIPVV